MKVIAALIRCAVLGSLADVEFRACMSDPAGYGVHEQRGNLLHCHARIARREVSS